ncbi:hypothetical protein CWT12_02340 [Actinomyces sp. 432]|uniref:hypothetical protein n=1 Tax=unclassified Actinomyces TaxID=2609248 RepID=UPI001373E401|nr:MULTISPECIES: hypothetical protein [unclassified Actinomyces]MBW3068655.1 hypothetical protein [Actinomyces sp. 594]QHO90410.1 hypothetical protein CWT12_02340 [Actinomyces sp. 432]
MAPSRKPDSKRYTVDYDWLWRREDPTARATLRLVVSHRSPRLAARAVERLLARLPAGSGGTRGSGGWVVLPVPDDPCALDIVSGGQDVADGIQSGADAIYDALIPLENLSLSWHELTPDTVPGRSTS